MRREGLSMEVELLLPQWVMTQTQTRRWPTRRYRYRLRHVEYDLEFEFNPDGYLGKTLWLLSSCCRAQFTGDPGARACTVCGVVSDAPHLRRLFWEEPQGGPLHQPRGYTTPFALWAEALVNPLEATLLVSDLEELVAQLVRPEWPLKKRRGWRA